MQNSRDQADSVLKKKYKVPILGQAVKIGCQNNDSRHKSLIIFEGNVIFANSRYVTVKGENYKESFMIEQFRTGEVKLLNE
jgi:hypothetical protein